MASTKKQCGYVKCKCDFYGGKRAIYCSQKCGQYQRRLDSKEALSSHNEKERVMKVSDVFHGKVGIVTKEFHGYCGGRTSAAQDKMINLAVNNHDGLVESLASMVDMIGCGDEPGENSEWYIVAKARLEKLKELSE